MKSGALDGLSIGFRTVKARSDPKSGVRRILEADLWEISVVTFPMLPSVPARIAVLPPVGQVDDIGPPYRAAARTKRQPQRKLHLVKCRHR